MLWAVPKMKAMIGGVAVVAVAIVGYWAHPFFDGPLRRAVHRGGGQDLICMPDLGANHFTIGGIHVWNPTDLPIEIKGLELERPVGVRIGRA